MRLVVGQLLALVERYPALVDGAFIIIAWVGVKLCLDYLHAAGYVALRDSATGCRSALIVVIFVIAFIYARIQGPVERRRARREGGGNPDAEDTAIDAWTRRCRNRSQATADARPLGESAEWTGTSSASYWRAAGVSVVSRRSPFRM